MYSDKLESVAQPSETERFPCVPRSAIFACVFQRCSDVSPSVRAAALRCLADITADQRGGVEGVVQQILSQVIFFSEVLFQSNNPGGSCQRRGDKGAGRTLGRGEPKSHWFGAN